MEIAIELDEGDSKEYEVKAICDGVVYSSKLESHLSNLYYLVLYKEYPEEENTWEPALAIQHLWRLVTIFHHDYLDKPITTFPLINSALPMIKLTVKSKAETSKTKQKQSQLTNSTSKCTKKNWTYNFLSRFLDLF